MVESSGLLNRRRVISSTGGSNPPLSASFNELARILLPASHQFSHPDETFPYVGSAKAANSKIE